MSLINEALKRAREEAARRQAAEKGLPLPFSRPVRDRARWLSLAVVILAGALLISLAVLVNISARLPATHRPPPAANPGVDRPGGREPLANQDAAQLEAEAPKIAAEGSSELPDIAALSQRAPHSSADTAESEMLEPSQPSDSPVAVVQEGVGTDSEALTELESVSESRVFVGQARLQDGQILDLEGIAWSESEPYALLNGQVIGVGELIRAYRVTEIQQDQVILEQGDDRIVLHLK